MGKAKIVAVGNFKGGVGKTTSAAHLAFALSEAGHKVLLVDLDSQGQSSLYLTDDKTLSGKAGGAEQLLDESSTISPTSTKWGIDVLHGHRGLGRIDEAGYPQDKAFKLRQRLEGLPYDFVVLDTPPDLAFRLLSALTWADVFLIVTTPDPLAMDSTLQLLNVIRGWLHRNLAKPGFKFRIALNMVDRSSASAVREAEQARRMAPQFVLQDELTHRRELLKRAFAQKIPVWQLKRVPKGVAEVWKNLPVALGLIEGKEA